MYLLCYLDRYVYIDRYSIDPRPTCDRHVDPLSTESGGTVGRGIDRMVAQKVQTQTKKENADKKKNKETQIKKNENENKKRKHSLAYGGCARSARAGKILVS